MSIVVVGGDKVGSIEKKLYSLGVAELVHISGRKKTDSKRVVLNRQTSAVLILTDFINHNLMDQVKLQARQLHIPVIFAKRSWAAIEQKLGAEGLVNYS
jgi:hypothetical protein